MIHLGNITFSSITSIRNKSETLMIVLSPQQMAAYIKILLTSSVQKKYIKHCTVHASATRSG